MPHKETSELRRFLALLIVLLSVIAVVVSLTRHDPPPKAAGVVLMASQRPHLMPDDTNPPTTTTVAVQPRAPMAPQVRWPAAPRKSRGCGRSLDQIKQDESGGSYTEVNPSSGAGGAYQALPSTWQNYRGYPRAELAPPAVQDEWAQKVYAQYGTKPWRASGC